MATLRLRFPGRRYHATPWGHHVNEGLIEWPPSPWRLLRALLATGYAKRHWAAEGPPPVARSLIEKLAAVTPAYRLPDAIGTHSRHYMPLARFKNGREDTTLVFDTWAQIDDGELTIRWDVELSAEECDELAALARELGYLGRSESWVEGELVEDDTGIRFDVVADDVGNRPGPDWEQVALLAPLSPADYEAWLREALQQAQVATGVDLAKPKHTAIEKKKLAASTAPFPADLIGCLQAETGWLRKLGWSQPPGSRKLLYWRHRDSLQAAAPRPKPRVPRAPAVKAMLLALGNASGNTSALPSILRVLPQGELLHRALVGNAARISDHSVVLSGCDEERKPLVTPHQHAHILHLDLDEDDRLDHVLIWAEMGLDADAQAAVRATRRTFMKGGTAPLRLALSGSGSRSDLKKLPPPFGQRLARVVGAFSTWRSLTPFVPPRFLKRSGRNTLLGQINAELASRGLPRAVNCQILDPQADDEARRARHFKRIRQRGKAPPQDIGFMLELQLEDVAPGPLALGYGSHFGLGLFSGI